MRRSERERRAPGGEVWEVVASELAACCVIDPVTGLNGGVPSVRAALMTEARRLRAFRPQSWMGGLAPLT
jgi:hypothetical protein